jgi:hypothetical protein
MKTEFMLSTFVGWARQLASRSLGIGIEVRVTKSDISDNPSARVDIDTPTTVARITCWESSDYDAEVIDIDTEQTIFSVHGRMQRKGALSKQFVAFFKAIGIAPE